MGTLQVALVDLRLGSPTFGARNTMYVGPLRPWHILIPPGVAHGYKVVGQARSDARVPYGPFLQSAGRRPDPLRRPFHPLRLGNPAQVIGAGAQEHALSWNQANAGSHRGRVPGAVERRAGALHYGTQPGPGARTFPTTSSCWFPTSRFPCRRRPPNLLRGGGPRNAAERRWWLWGTSSGDEPAGRGVDPRTRFRRAVSPPPPQRAHAARSFSVDEPPLAPRRRAACAAALRCCWTSGWPPW